MNLLEKFNEERDYFREEDATIRFWSKDGGYYADIWIDGVMLHTACIGKPPTEGEIQYAKEIMGIGEKKDKEWWTEQLKKGMRKLALFGREDYHIDKDIKAV